MISRKFCLWKDSAAKYYSKTKKSSVTEDSNNLISLQYYKALVCIRKHLNCLVRFSRSNLMNTLPSYPPSGGGVRVRECKGNKPIAINASPRQCIMCTLFSLTDDMNQCFDKDRELTFSFFLFLFLLLWTLRGTISSFSQPCVDPF